MKKMVASVLIGIAILAIAAVLAGYGNAEEVCTYTEYTVQHGDTLWDIASGCNRNEDVRKVIYDIKALNNLESAAIHCGDVLLVPCGKNE